MREATARVELTKDDATSNQTTEAETIKMPEYCYLLRDGAKYLADQNIRGESWNVLFILLGNLSFGNTCRLPRKEIARIAQKKPQNIDRALKNLIEANVIRRVTRRGQRMIELNPEITWKGESVNRLYARASWRRHSKK